VTIVNASSNSVPVANTWPEPAPHPPHGYLDAVAGQPVLPIAQQALIAALEQGWSDPARLHHTGRRAGLVLDTSRAAIASFLDVPSADCYLGASASDLLRAVIGGLVAARVSAGAAPRILIGASESMAVGFAAQACPGCEVVTIPVDRHARVDASALAAELDRGAAVVCVQLANAEVGTVQPSEDIHALCQAHDVPLVSDGTQVAGHAHVGHHWDALVASPRDWSGPSGVSVLIVGPHVRWRPPEAPDRGWVGGFPDIAAAAGAAAASEYLAPLWATQANIQREQIQHLREAVEQVPGVRAVGDPHDRLPHIVTIVADDAIGEHIVTELDKLGVAAASGSACTADNRMPSHVLEAMGIQADASIRVSLPLGCTDETVQAFIDQFPVVLGQARL